ncbi:MAG: lanthionine synthetase LanC family protein [Casimicrobiaceae bacterium]
MQFEPERHEPLNKGAGLCHGTAGNGYALLKFYRRTGDAIWLERARSSTGSYPTTVDGNSH